MSEWKECKLGDVAEITSSKRVFYAEYVTSGVPFYRSKEIIDLHNKRNISTELFISEKKYNEIKVNYGVPVSGDILLTSVGSLGIPYKVSHHDRFYFKDGNLTWFRKINANILDTDYLLLWLNSSIGKQKLDEITIGSTQPALTISGLKTVDILLPTLPEQKAIAEVLSSLDDKIDLLHRQNKTLEAMAEALFRQWFVEPCNEKLPEEWKEGKLNDICSVITKGTTPTTLGNQFTVSGINFIKVESITEEGNFIFDKFAKISNETHEILKRSIIQSDDVLCSIAGTIGRIAIVDESILPANTNQAIAILRVEKEKYYSEFLYLFMKSKLFQEVMDGKIVHAVQPNLSLGEIGNTDICIPSQKELKDFKVIITPIFSKKKKNQAQIRCLEKQRNVLLPKLMSGEVRVSL